MSEREDLEQAITAVEAQRATLGDAAVDAALQGLRQQLALKTAAEQAEAEREAQAAAGERRIVTVLFCDVTGSTALAEQMDPEAWANIMNEAFAFLTEPIDRYGGTVARLMGDAILALFGAPTAHEDDPQRAIEASLAILRGIQPFKNRLQQKSKLEFNVRVGINTGLVVTGRVGSGLHGEYTALGDAANLAARMEQTALPGTIQISESTYRLIATQYDCLSLGGIAVKGRSEPVPAYRVLGRKTPSEQQSGSARHRLKSPLVGRAAEFSAGHQAIANLLSGQGGILSLVGEAGVGKSRLVAELRQESPLELLHWLEGRTLSYGQNISYWPFQEILWTFAGISEEDSESEAWQKLEQEVHHLFAQETGEVLPFLASLIGLDVREAYAERIRHLDSEAIGHQIYLATRRFCERLASDRPAVLVFEDLHWADQSSAALLEHLLPLSARLPILFLITSRPYRQSAFASFRQVASRDLAEGYQELSLAPLSPADSAELARNLLQIDQMPGNVQSKLLGKASGNPFFLEEIVRALISSGAVVYDKTSGRWRATTRIETIAIPDTVQGVIIARVDRLDEDARRLLQTASVVGRSFFYRVLETMGHIERALDQNLQELEQAELIRKKQMLPELEYIFNHALAQEATYESILLSRRREIHATVGQAIETLFAERLEEFYGVLAYHYARAELWEKAQAYLLKAGDKAGQVAADAEALAHYEQALTAYERAFGNQWDPGQRALLARKMGEAYFRRGEHEQALNHFQQAMALLGRPPLPVSGRDTLKAIGRELLRQLAHRLLPTLFTKASAQDVSLAVEEEARIHNFLGWIYLFTDRERFLWASLRRLNFAEQNGFLPGAAAGGAAVAVVWDLIPLLKLAYGYHQRAVRLAEKSGDLNALGIAYQAIGFYELNMGNFPGSESHVRRSESVFRQAGDLHGLGNALNLLAFIRVHRGDLRDSLDYIQELIDTGQDGNDPQLVSWGCITQGLARQRLGQPDQALASLQQGVSIAESLPDYYWKIMAQAFLGQYHLWQDQMDLAFAALNEGHRVQIEQAIGGPPLYHLRIVQAEAHLTAAFQGPDAARGEQLRLAGRAVKAALKLARAYRLFLVEALRLEGRYLWLQGKPGAAQKRWTQAVAQAEAQESRYELGVVHWEIGTWLGESAHLESAAAILGDLGAAWLLDLPVHSSANR